MEKPEILNEITKIVRQVLEDDEIVLTEEKTAKEVQGWDSLNHIQIITAIEKHFKIKFKLTEILDFKNIGMMCETIIEKLTMLKAEHK